MPNRYLRESYIESERVNAVSMGAEVLWTHLLMKVDDFGCCEAGVKTLRPKLFPLRLGEVTEADVEKWLTECEDADLLRRYESGGKKFLEIGRWERGRAKAPKWPVPPWGSSNLGQPQTSSNKPEHLPTDPNISPDSDSDSDSDSDLDTVRNSNVGKPTTVFQISPNGEPDLELVKKSEEIYRDHLKPKSEDHKQRGLNQLSVTAHAFVREGRAKTLMAALIEIHSLLLWWNRNLAPDDLMMVPCFAKWLQGGHYDDKDF